MAHDKTWQFDINHVFGDVSAVANQGAWFLWYLKALVTGQIALTDANGASIASPQGLWTIVGSSDGVTGALDGVDRWGSTFDNTKMVWATAEGTAHSWVVLQAPAGLGTFYILISLIAATSGAYVKIVTSAPTFTGGSATNSPSGGTDLGQTVKGTANLQFVEGISGVARKAHGLLATDGSFLFLGSRDGSGVFSSSFMLNKIVDAKAGDTAPFAFNLSYNAAGVHRVADWWANTAVNAWAIKTNTATPSGFLVSLSDVSRGGSGGLGALFGGSVDSFDNLWNDWPIWVVPASSPTLKGRLSDVRMTHQYPGDGSVYPLSGQITDMVVGMSWVPANAAPSL